MLCNPRIVPSGVIRYPIDNDRHVAVVRFCSECAQIGQCPVFTSHFIIILDAVWRIHGVDLSDWINWHEPNDVDVQRLQLIQSVDYPLKISA